ncbi:MAG TPA: hypothetical protein DEB39_01040 [Planctomycetaceae bacterium]|nr:hypothetical protein [Planctomycetaceae bacterium]
MSEEEKKQLSAKLSKQTKQMLDEQAEEHGLTRTQYLERLIEGTLPNRLEERMDAIRIDILAEIEKLREEIKK